MRKLIEIGIDYNIVVSSIIKKQDTPDVIYIPINPEDEILVKQNSKVLIGMPIYKRGDSIVTSPISGTITTIKRINTLNGVSDGIEILNDFKEKSFREPKSKLSLKGLNKDIIRELLNTFNINIKDNDNLIINSIDDEPYVHTENFYLLLYYEEFLELIDEFSSVFNLKSITICVKSTSSENINKLMDFLGMYPNIKINILPNLYMIGNDTLLIKQLNLDDNTCVIKSSTLYAVYNLIKRNRVVSDKLITISGNNIDKPSIVRIKIGTKLIDILKDFKIKEDALYIVNGLMSGKIINIADFIVTNDINSILIMKPKAKKREKECLKCGMCQNVCPVNINPLLLDEPSYYNLVKGKCLKCGLCSYICPSYINFREKLER